MKRLPGLFLLAALVLAGCSRAPKMAVEKSNPSGPDVSSAPKKDALIAPSLAPANAASISFTPETGSLVSSEEVPLLEQINQENARVVAAALPSIVRITATRPVDPRMKLFGSDLPFQLPFGTNPHRYPPSNDPVVGSGVILSRDGYILTNGHVVEDTTLVEVQLSDKRSFTARVVASDDLIDVAVLKIDATGLQPLPWGDSDRVQVGEQVFAIGNPFDLDDSVSKGIVSAKGRNLPESAMDGPHYEDYIQTDAAINPGNSGGALVDIHGQLIGLNAAIASTTRFNMGIGFAIPSNLVRYAVSGLLKEGHLMRGYLGVILPVSVDDGVIAQLNLKSSEGAFLAGVQPGSPADKAKLHPFDFVTAVDGHKVDSEAGLRLVVAQVPAGKVVRVDFVRDGRPRSTQVQIGDPPADDEPISPPPAVSEETPLPDSRWMSPANVLSGVQVADLNDKARQKFGVDNLVTSGVVVIGVQEGSLAEIKGIERGDVIESVSVIKGQTESIATAKDFSALSGGLKAGQGVVLLVHDRDRANDRDKASIVYLAPPAK
jgi:serine protease Do